MARTTVSKLVTLADAQTATYRKQIEAGRIKIDLFGRDEAGPWLRCELCGRKVHDLGEHAVVILVKDGDGTETLATEMVASALAEAADRYNTTIERRRIRIDLKCAGRRLVKKYAVIVPASAPAPIPASLMAKVEAYEAEAPVAEPAPAAAIRARIAAHKATGNPVGVTMENTERTLNSAASCDCTADHDCAEARWLNNSSTVKVQAELYGAHRAGVAERLAAEPAPAIGITSDGHIGLVERATPAAVAEPVKPAPQVFAEACTAVLRAAGAGRCPGSNLKIKRRAQRDNFWWFTCRVCEQPIERITASGLLPVAPVHAPLYLGRPNIESDTAIVGTALNAAGDCAGSDAIMLNWDGKRGAWRARIACQICEIHGDWTATHETPEGVIVELFGAGGMTRGYPHAAAALRPKGRGLSRRA